MALLSLNHHLAAAAVTAYDDIQPWLGSTSQTTHEVVDPTGGRRFIVNGYRTDGGLVLDGHYRLELAPGIGMLEAVEQGFVDMKGGLLSDASGANALTYYIYYKIIRCVFYKLILRKSKRVCFGHDIGQTIDVANGMAAYKNVSIHLHFPTFYPHSL